MTRAFLTPRWIITTLVVIAAVGVMVRLGIWQLDRLEERRAFNARVSAQQAAPALDLAAALAQGEVGPRQLPEMEYRSVILRGEYRPEEQVIWRNQVWEGLPGAHLLTPLYLEGTPYVVLVDRGWIPLEERNPDDWKKYDQSGKIEVIGILQRGQDERRFGVPDPTLEPGQPRLPAWNAVRLARIAGQVEGEILPVFVLAAPQGEQGGAEARPPYPATETPDLSEGPHMGYALQWFGFAAVLAIGYPLFVKKQLTSGS